MKNRIFLKFIKNQKGLGTLSLMPITPATWDFPTGGSLLEGCPAKS